ncbi:ATPase, T2SS/T4P/T4SS family, partial [Salmonella enterica subsp. enterica serovar Kentucky]|nr:ATPase, T2SS/T4P/T4SS family [Salmonella enterica subsp. enterica serovar Kentucky]
QTQIHPRAGLTFQNVLRALLRQDPDIIMVGEIRDGDTAEIAIQGLESILGALDLTGSYDKQRTITIGTTPSVGALVMPIIYQAI